MTISIASRFPAALPRRTMQGFSLLEMAVVLAVLMLLLGGALAPLAAHMQQKRYGETRSELEDIREALIGYAMMHGRLPCPSTQPDPNHPDYGVENPSCQSDAATDGFLPWKTLGVAETDAWGIRRDTAGAPWLGYWRYRVDRNFSNATAPISLSTAFADRISVRNSAGQLLTTNDEFAVAVIYSPGPDGVPNGQNASYEATNALYEADTPSPAFDDLTLWIGRPLLTHALVKAGRVP